LRNYAGENRAITLRTCEPQEVWEKRLPSLAKARHYDGRFAEAIATFAKLQYADAVPRLTTLFRFS
jgi:hypothetical protein